jgi:hypothetical protein
MSHDSLDAIIAAYTLAVEAGLVFIFSGAGDATVSAVPSYSITPYVGYWQGGLKRQPVPFNHNLTACQAANLRHGKAQQLRDLLERLTVRVQSFHKLFLFEGPTFFDSLIDPLFAGFLPDTRLTDVV